MTLLDLQGMQLPGGKKSGGGSTLSAAACGSNQQHVSNLSLTLCAK
jgi:hypothetical protein